MSIFPYFSGIGTIPDQVLSCLWSHKDIGVHTEMFSDGLVDLVERGVITNAKKRVHQGKIVGGFCVGTQRLYDFIDNNPSLGEWSPCLSIGIISESVV